MKLKRNKMQMPCATHATLFCILLPILLFPAQTVSANAQYQKDYIAAVLPWAQQAHAQYGVPISVAIAQSAKETGWYLPKSSNNLYNIKAVGSDPYTTGATSDGWRAYGSGSDAVLGYGYLLTHDPNFTGRGGAGIDCRPDLNNPLQFLHDLAFDGFEGGYNATTGKKQAYYDDVSGIISYNNLTQYDQIVGTDTDIWVDGGYGGAQNGTQANPYSTVKAAVDRASATQAGTIHIKPGTYSEKIGTNRHIHFVTNGPGTVRIGG